MALNRKKTGGRDFKKGQSGNPSGRARLPQEIRDAKRVTSEKFIALTSKYLNATKLELADALKEDALPYLDRIVINVIQRAADGADLVRLDMLLNRIIGKVPDKIESENLHIIEQVKALGDLSDKELSARAKEALRALDDQS